MKQGHHTSIRLDDDIYIEIQALSVQLDRSASWIIRQAIKCGLRTMQESAGNKDDKEATPPPNH